MLDLNGAVQQIGNLQKEVAQLHEDNAKLESELKRLVDAHNSLATKHNVLIDEMTKTGKAALGSILAIAVVGFAMIVVKLLGNW